MDVCSHSIKSAMPICGMVNPVPSVSAAELQLDSANLKPPNHQMPTCQHPRIKVGHLARRCHLGGIQKPTSNTSTHLVSLSPLKPATSSCSTVKRTASSQHHTLITRRLGPGLLVVPMGVHGLQPGQPTCLTPASCSKFTTLEELSLPTGHMHQADQGVTRKGIG